MEFQTNKETGTQSSNGKYNYAGKLVRRMQILTVRGSDEIVKKLECECAVRQDTFIYLGNVKVKVVNMPKKVDD